MSVQVEEEVSEFNPTELRTANSVKVPSIIQIEMVECGAASLGMILANWDRWIPLEELRTACGVSRDGSSMIDILRAGRRLGLVGKAFRGGVEVLDGIEVPAVIWWDSNHFVVLEQIAKGQCRINDPASGRRTLSIEEFMQHFSGAAISFKPGENFEPGGAPSKTWPGLVARIRRSKDGVWLAFLAGLFALVPGLLLPPISQIFVTQVLGGGESRLIPTLVAVLVVVIVVRFVLNRIAYSALVRLQNKILLVGASSLLVRLFQMPITFFQSRNTGDLVNRVDSSSLLAQMLSGQLAGIFINCFAIVAYSALMFWYNWVLALVVLVLALGNVLALQLILRMRAPIQDRVTREMAHVQTESVTTIQAIETIKANASEQDSFVKWSAANARASSVQRALAPTDSLLSGIPVLATALTAAVILVIGGWQVMLGNLTLGEMVAFQALAAGIGAPIAMLFSAAEQIQDVSSSIRRIDDVMMNKPDQRFDQKDTSSTATATAEPPKLLSGGIELTEVTFGYSSTRPPLVENFSVNIAPGSRVALVGGSGSGKSTIVNLIAGLIHPWSGEIRFDGLTPSQIPPGLLESTMTKVDQKIVLFEGTVRENVTFWDATITEESVRQALADARILDDVLARPGGLDTYVAESGRNFSGGQRQRLEIARALATDPRIMILDEATSALDPLTEQEIDDALRARGCTTVVVAHRLSTVRDADEIIVLGTGAEVLERGQHDELLELGGHYSVLVASSGEGGALGA